MATVTFFIYFILFRNLPGLTPRRRAGAAEDRATSSGRINFWTVVVYPVATPKDLGPPSQLPVPVPPHRKLAQRRRLGRAAPRATASGNHDSGSPGMPAITQ